MTAFTAHNVILPGGRETMPGVTPLAETGICKAALRDLDMAFTGLPGTPVVADLGCLEGGYAAAFARAGYDVTGIEARDDNFACCEEVEAALGLDNLRFAKGDVRDLMPALGEWDAVFCCGLLYHLNEPVAFLDLLGKVTRRLLILQTHYSARPESVHEGYTGNWFSEGGADNRWSSWGNAGSFWLAKDELIRAVSAAGFGLVYEQHDYRPPGEPYRDMFGNLERDRCMVVGLKP